MGFFTCLALVGSASVSALGQELNVGYLPGYGMSSYPFVKGSEGYFYDYVLELKNYTQETYQPDFVPYDQEEVYRALAQGEIDLFGPCVYREELAQAFSYSQHPIGQDSYFLATLDDGTHFFSDYRQLEGSVIAVEEDSPGLALLEEFLDYYQLSAQIETYDNSNFIPLLQMGRVDFSVSSAMELDSRLKMIAKIGEMPLYYLMNRENEALVADLEEAHQQLLSQTYLFATRLHFKYYDFNLAQNTYVSPADSALLQEQPVYTVGFSSEYTALSYLDGEDQPAGVLIDMMDALAEEAGISLDYVDLAGTLFSYEDQDLNLLLWSPGDLPAGGQESTAYLTLPFFLVKSYQSFDHLETIGLMNYCNKETLGLESLYPESSFRYYTSYLALEKAYEEGEIQGLLLTTLSLGELRASLDFEANTMNPVDKELPLTITFPPEFPQEKVDIFNKYLTEVDQASLEYSIITHSNILSEKTSWEVLQDNPLIAVGFFALLFLWLRVAEMRKKQELKHLIDFDDVTGLLSERKFSEEVGKILGQNPQKQYSLLSVDIDNFKYVNEIYGYERGTQALALMGTYIKEISPAKTPVARCFSDNFLVLVDSTNLSYKLSHAMSKDNQLYDQLTQLIGESYNFSFSLGLYHIKDPGLSLSYMIDCCNIARSIGKKTVGTTLHVFSEAMDQERIANNEIVANMDQALNGREFSMYYQPKFRMKDQSICGAEALVRWIQGDTIIPPNDFIPLFEKNGFIEKLDYYVLSEVCSFIHNNQDRDLPVISLNLSGITIMKPNLVENLMGILKEHGVRPQQLDLEITESALVDNFDLAIKKIDILRNLGFTLSMDDFGTGISTLHRLKELSIDVLKIDRAFIVDSLDHEKGSTIIKNILQMAKDLNLETVAEGIETQDQLAFLSQLGCDVGQGYYYSRPLPKNEFLATLQRDHQQFRQRKKKEK